MPPKPIGVRLGGCADMGGYTGLNEMPLTILDAENASAHGARCLDGGPPGFYSRKATAVADKDKWVIYLKGGGHCYNAKTCAAAARTPYGSTARFPRRFGLDGILSTDAEVNPLFGSWNHVLLWYCDGAVWLGARKTPLHTYDSDGQPLLLYFRGRKVLQHLLDHLMNHRGLSTASEVLFSGDCAGGTAVHHMLDEMADRLLPSAKVRAAVDSSYFIYLEDPVTHQEIFHTPESFPVQQPLVLRGECERARPLTPTRKEAFADWECGFGGPLHYPLRRTPIFVVQSMVDSCMLDNQWHGLNGSMVAARGGCLDRNLQLSACDATEASHVAALQRKMLAHFEASGKLGPGLNGGFLHTCLGHGDGLRKNDAFTGVRIKGVSVRDALSIWWADEVGNTSHWYRPCSMLDRPPWQCNPSCAAWKSAEAQSLQTATAGSAVISTGLQQCSSYVGHAALIIFAVWQLRHGVRSEHPPRCVL